MLYLTSWNIDARRAHEKCTRSKPATLKRIGRGIYIEPEDDANTLIREYAFRIAAHLNPKSELVGPSVVTHQPINDVVYVASERKRIDRVGPITIRSFHAKLAFHPHLYTLADASGTIPIPLSPPPKALVESLMLDEEGYIRLNDATWVKLLSWASNSASTYGNIDAVSRAVNEAAQRLKRPDLAEIVNPQLRAFHAGRLHHTQTPAQSAQASSDTSDTAPDTTRGDYDVYWYGRAIAHLRVGDQSSALTYHDSWLLPLTESRHQAHMALPPCIDALVTDQAHLDAGKGPNKGSKTARPSRVISDVYRIGNNTRLLGNIDIMTRGSLSRRPADRRQARLSDFSDPVLLWFKGHSRLDDTLSLSDRALRRQIRESNLPRLPGKQIKVACYLDTDGTIYPADAHPFTHILKRPAHRGNARAQGVLEWAGLSMARAAGLETATFALFPVDDHVPALIVERFDIPDAQPHDHRLIWHETMLSVLEQNTYNQSMREAGLEQLARRLKGLVTDWNEDRKRLFHQAVVAHLIGDDNMDLQGMGLLRTADPTLTTWQDVRLSPAYGLTAAAGLAAGLPRQSIAIAGQHEDITAGHLVESASHLGLSDTEALGIVVQSASAIQKWAQQHGPVMVGLMDKHHGQAFAETIYTSIQAAAANAAQILEEARRINKAFIGLKHYPNSISPSHVVPEASQSSSPAPATDALSTPGF